MAARHPRGQASLESGIKQVLAVQCGAMILLLLCIWALSGFWSENETDGGPHSAEFIAGFYGSVLALMGTMLNARAVKRGFGTGGGATDSSGPSSMIPIYSGLLNKLAVVGGGMAFGLVFLALEPVFVVTGYIIVQSSSVCAMFKSES